MTIFDVLLMGVVSETFPTLWLIVNVQVMEVIGFLFQYLKMLRSVGPQEWVFQEQKAISKLNFEYSEDPSQDEYAVSLASMSFPLSCLKNKHLTILLQICHRFPSETCIPRKFEVVYVDCGLWIDIGPFLQNFIAVVILMLTYVESLASPYGHPFNQIIPA